MPYVYRHIRLDINQPFYIGIGSDELYERSISHKSRNKHWMHIVNKIDYRIEILLDDLTWDEACEKEREFISLYGRRDLGTGLLVNMTDGGEGLTNPSIELRQHMSTRNKGRTAWNKGLIGFKHSDETIEKMRKKRPVTSEKLKGRKQSIEVIQNRVEKNTGKKRSDETKLKISNATLGKSKLRKSNKGLDF
jgi:hypothetical protein